MREKQVSYHPACNTLDPSECLTPTRMASRRCGTPFTMINVIIHWPWHLSFWPAHTGTAPSTHPLKHYLPSSHSVWYQVAALRSAPTTSSACLFSAQPKYQRFLQGRAEGAVPTGSFTPPWGHCSLPLCIQKPQLCQHHQVGAELSLSGTGKKRSYLPFQHHTTREKTTTTKLWACGSPKARGLHLPGRQQKSRSIPENEWLWPAIWFPTPAHESCGLPPSYHSVPPVFIGRLC